MIEVILVTKEEIILLSKLRVSCLVVVILLVFQATTFAAAGSNLLSEHPPFLVTPTITLISPNGGEVWDKGLTYKITWTYTALLACR